MSDYVEASYALVVLTQARQAQPSAARRLIVDYLRDCALVDKSTMARRETLAAIGKLRSLLDYESVPQEEDWEIAFKAAERWQQQG